MVSSKRRGGYAQLRQTIICVGSDIDRFEDTGILAWEPPAPRMELFHAVWAAAERCLTTKQLDILRLYYLDGYSGVEIALQYDCTQATISTTVRRAITDVRTELARTSGY
jgi:DNA-directed RNA polymerase specialized sigma24 family protein